MRFLTPPSFNRNFLNVLIYSAALLMLVPNYFALSPSMGLDSSWILAINMAYAKGLRFGSEFIFTYGPLGFLHTRLVESVPPALLFLFDLFVTVNLMGIFFVLTKDSRVLWPKLVFLSLLYFFTSVTSYVYEAPFTLLLFMFYWLVYGYRRQRIWPFFVALASVGLLFFIKVNLGLVAVLLFSACVGVGAYAQVIKPQAVVAIAATLLFFLGCMCWLLNVDFIAYVQASFPVINHYNDAMSLIGTPLILLYLGAVAGVSLCFGYLLLLTWRSSRQNIGWAVTWAFVGAGLFLSFKQGFVRADCFHVGAFFMVVPFLCLLFTFQPFAPNLRAKYKLVAAVVIITCAVMMQVIEYDQYLRTGGEPSLKVYTFYKFKNELDHVRAKYEIRHFDSVKPSYILTFAKAYATTCLNNILPKHYVAGFLQTPAPSSDVLLSRRLPETLLRRIGNRPVDIMSYEIAYLHYNRLNYCPRPMIQSYQAYDGYLDSLNMTKYRSVGGPHYVLYHNQTIDRRHPFWDEPRTRLTLLTHYQLIDKAILPQYNSNQQTVNGVQDTLLVLERRASPVRLKTVGRRKITIRLGEFVPLSSTKNMIELSANVDYSLLGRAERFFFQPEKLFVTLRHEDGSERTFRVLQDILHEGILVNKRLKTHRDVISFFGGNPASASPSITHFKIHPSRQFAFRKEVQAEVRELALESGTLAYRPAFDDSLERP